jgi:thioredoxin 1
VKHLFLTMLSMLVATAAAAELPSANVEATSQALASGKSTVIDLGARTCIPCKQMAPVLEELAGTYRGKANVLFIDVREDRNAASRFGIQMIPTQIFFDSKGKEVSRHIGFMDRPDLVKGLQAAGLK